MADLHPLLPHGPLEPAFTDVWWLRGTVRLNALVTISRTMVVVRDAGELVLLNAVRLDESGLAALEALGPVRHVVKIGSHGMDDRWWLARTGATYWTLPGVEPPPEARARAVLGDDGLPIADARLFRFEAVPPEAPEAALLLERDGGVLLTCDSVMNFTDFTGCNLLGRLSARIMGFDRPAQVGVIWRRVFDKPRGCLAPDFRRLLGLEFRHLVGGHGPPLRDGAREALAATVRELWGEAA